MGADAPEPFWVTVAGFQYQVFFKSHNLPHRVSHFRDYHWSDGEAVEIDCPLSETGSRDHWFAPCLMEKHESQEDAAIDAIQQLQCVARYEGRQTARKAAELKANQLPLF